MDFSKNTFSIIIDRLICFFLYMLLFWLPYSSAVIESCVVTGLVLFVIKRIYQFVQLDKKTLKNFLVSLKPKESFLNNAIYLYLFICMISAINSVVYEIAFHGLVSKVLEWFIIYFLVLEVFTTKKRVKTALIVLMVTAFSTILDSFWQYYFSHKDIFFGHTIGLGMRATAGFKTPNGLGAYLTLFIPFSLSTVFYWKNNISKWVSFFIFLLSFWSIIIAFSRGAFMGALMGLLFLIFFLRLQGKPVKKNYVFLFVAIFGILAITGILVMNSHYVVDLLNRKGTADGRLSIWLESLQLIKDRPLFGHGINTFMRIFQYYRKVPSSSPTFAHNCYIQMAVEVGIVGLVSFLVIILKLFLNQFRKRETCYSSNNFQVLSLGLLAGIFAFLVHSFFDNNLYSLQLSAFLWYMIGLYVAMDGLKKLFNS